VGSVQQKSERNRGYQRRDSSAQGYKQHLTLDPPRLNSPSLENGGGTAAVARAKAEEQGQMVDLLLLSTN